MNPMAIDRRSFLRGLAAGCLAVSLPARAGAAPLAVLSAWSLSRNEHRAGSPDGQRAVPLAQRGHHIEPDPRRRGRAWVFARRPGREIQRIDWQRGRTLARFDYPENRHGFGHGVFAHGQLYTTDSDIDTGHGLIAVRDPDTLQVRREFPSAGIGPHQLLACADGGLLVANGGILTLPESGRIKLNRHSMQPDLCLLDPASGQLRGRWTLPDAQLSIRHLADAGDGWYGVALQAENLDHGLPLAAVWHADHGLTLLRAPEAIEAACLGYAASIAACGPLLAITATRGQRVLFWRRDGEYLGEFVTPRPAGIAATPNQDAWVVSNEHGELHWLDARTREADPARGRSLPVMWDNHLVVVS